MAELPIELQRCLGSKDSMEKKLLSLYKIDWLYTPEILLRSCAKGEFACQRIWEADERRLVSGMGSKSRPF